jgi:hypothetical protein
MLSTWLDDARHKGKEARVTASFSLLGPHHLYLPTTAKGTIHPLILSATSGGGGTPPHLVLALKISF